MFDFGESVGKFHIDGRGDVLSVNIPFGMRLKTLDNLKNTKVLIDNIPCDMISYEYWAVHRDDDTVVKGPIGILVERVIYL